MSEPFPPAYTVAPLKDGEVGTGAVGTIDSLALSTRLIRSYCRDAVAALQWKWSLWDRMDVDLGDCTLRQLIQHFEVNTIWTIDWFY